MLRLYWTTTFLLLKSIPYQRIYQKRPSLEKTISHISAVSFGTYLLHPLLILLVERGTLGFQVRANVNPPWVTIPVLYGVSALGSILSVSLLRKVPGLKYLAG